MTEEESRSVGELVSSNILFLVVAVMLAFGIYQTMGVAFNTSTPVVSVVSNSMKPAFERGDLILVAGTTYEDIAVGDVLVFESKHDTIADNMPPLIHRVIAKRNGTVDTKGDANSDQIMYCLGRGFYMTGSGCQRGEQLVRIEENITESQILGELVMVVPKAGYAKLVPTCVVMELQYPSDHPQLDYMCGDMWWR